MQGSLERLIQEALDQGYDVTIRLRRRDDVGKGRVTMPNSWLRRIGMTDADIDRAQAVATQERQALPWKC
jgi:hypothetical protein